MSDQPRLTITLGEGLEETPEIRQYLDQLNEIINQPGVVTGVAEAVSKALVAGPAEKTSAAEVAARIAKRQ